MIVVSKIVPDISNNQVILTKKLYVPLLQHNKNDKIQLYNIKHMIQF